MPFKEKEFPQNIYTNVVKSFVEDQFKIGCYRVDDDNLPDRIDNKIYSYLLRSAFVIAEVTTRNPNVFYELGLAHMLEKDCIIVTSTPITEIPFDINRIRAEHYDSDQQLTEILRRAISALAFKSKQGVGQEVNKRSGSIPHLFLLRALQKSTDWLQTRVKQQKQQAPNKALNRRYQSGILCLCTKPNGLLNATNG